MAPQQPQLDIEGEVGESDGNESGNENEGAQDSWMGRDDEFGDVVDDLDEEAQKDTMMDLGMGFIGEYLICSISLYSSF